MSQSNEQLPGWARQMLVEARVGHLGMLDDRDRPRVLPVTFVFHAESIWTAVDHKPKRAPGHELARVRFLGRQPQAAFTVDHYSEDWRDLAWVQALGRVLVLSLEDEPDAVAALSARYEPYRRDLPPGPLLCLAPERFITWRATD
jgi:PPOX class probable F420-dependent enzyme